MNNVLITQDEQASSHIKKRTPLSRMKTQPPATEPSEPDQTTTRKEGRSPGQQYLHFPKLNRFYDNQLEQCSLREIVTESPRKPRKQQQNMEVSLELNKMTPKDQESFLRYRGASAKLLQRKVLHKEPSFKYFVKSDVFEHVRSNKNLSPQKLSAAGQTAPMRLRIDKTEQKGMRRTSSRYADLNGAGDFSPNKSAIGGQSTGISYKPVKRTATDHSYYRLKEEISRANFKAGRELYMQMMGIKNKKVHDWLAD